MDPSDNTGATSNFQNKASYIGKITALPIFLLLGFMFYFFEPNMNDNAQWTACIAVLMVLLWVTEAIPLAATALLPLVLFPVFDILNINDTAASYAHQFIFLFLGGFLLSLTIERWGLHKRIALNIIRLFGSKPRNLIAGFMIAVAFLSMWVSNTASVIMMLPIALSVASLNTERTNSQFPVALLVSIAAAANIGGIATLIGSPPNVLFASFISDTYSIDIGFYQWLIFAGPISLLLLVISWTAITFLVFKIDNSNHIDAVNITRNKIPWSREEIIVLSIFTVVVFLWIFRQPLASIPFIETYTPFISSLLNRLSDASIALGASIILFTIPAKEKDSGKSTSILNWETTLELPWDILILFGGGLALSKGITSTGLDLWIGDQLTIFSSAPIWAMVFISAFFICLLTEMASNTAITAAFLPVLHGLAISLNAPPCHLLLPAALAASCAFMLPVATPPNAIVFGSGYLSISDMLRSGWRLNIIATVIISLYVLLLGRTILDL